MSYFTISELTRSATAAREGIDNTPPQAAVDNMKRLINTVLNPARQQLKAPHLCEQRLPLSGTQPPGGRCPTLLSPARPCRRSHHPSQPKCRTDGHSTPTSAHGTHKRRQRRMDTCGTLKNGNPNILCRFYAKYLDFSFSFHIFV